MSLRLSPYTYRACEEGRNRISPCSWPLGFPGESSCRVPRGGWELVSLTLLYLDSVTKTNLSVHEDKNRVPFVKVRAGWVLVCNSGVKSLGGGVSDQTMGE